MGLEILHSYCSGQLLLPVHRIDVVATQSILRENLLVASAALQNAGEGLWRRSQDGNLAMALRYQMLDGSPSPADVVGRDRVEGVVLGIGVDQHQRGRATQNLGRCL